MSEWISVKERLPECGAIVLCNTDYFIEVLQWDARSCVWVGETRIYNRDRVTHWMPLPEPPVAVAENATTTATGSKTERVRCADCKHLMYSDCYGECGAGHRGIVRPDDTCPHGERRADDG